MSGLYIHYYKGNGMGACIEEDGWISFWINMLGGAVTGLPRFTAPNQPSGVRLTASYQQQDGLLPLTWCHTLMPPANLQLQLPTGLEELMEIAMAYVHGSTSFGPTKTIKSLILIVGNQIKRPINSIWRKKYEVIFTNIKCHRMFF